MTTLCCFLFLFPIHRWPDQRRIILSLLLICYSWITSFQHLRWLLIPVNIQTDKNAVLCGIWTYIMYIILFKSMSKVIYPTTNSCKSWIIMKSLNICIKISKKNSRNHQLKLYTIRFFFKCLKYLVFNNKHCIFGRGSPDQESLKCHFSVSPVSALEPGRGGRWWDERGPAENCGIMLRVNVLAIISGCWILNGICPSSSSVVSWLWARARQDLHPIS